MQNYTVKNTFFLMFIYEITMLWYIFVYIGC